MTATPVGARLLRAMRRRMTEENECDDALLLACGIDPEQPGQWPLGDIWYDDYDSSFEFGGVRPGWEPTAAQLADCLALGFSRCWLNYTDGAETYFAAGEFHRKTAEQMAGRPPRRDSGYKRTLRHMAAALAKYGGHWPSCPAHPMFFNTDAGSCSCGWEAVERGWLGVE